jgi:hypothetical protein
MKKVLLLSFTALLIAGGCKSSIDAPPFAASTRTWTFGGQTWSDAIRIPECNKTSFSNSIDVPDCRSYNVGSETWYYYNWAYVVANQNALCPPPWRVPTPVDYAWSTSIDNMQTLTDAWGLPGWCRGNARGGDGRVLFAWTKEEKDETYAYALACWEGFVSTIDHLKPFGFVLRCCR